jgi:hypothetical protein
MAHPCFQKMMKIYGILLWKKPKIELTQVQEVKVNSSEKIEKVQPEASKSKYKKRRVRKIKKILSKALLIFITYRKEAKCWAGKRAEIYEWALQQDFK